MDKVKLCECGCGQPVTKPTNRFLKGHWARTKEAKDILSESTEKYFSENREEFKQLMSDVMNRPETKEKLKEVCKSPKRMKHIQNLANDDKVKLKRSRSLIKLFEDMDFKRKHKESVQGINKGSTPWNKGIPFKAPITEEVERVRVRKIRTTHLRIIQERLENGHQISPNYNPAACKVIDKYGKKHGYNFQHAENGGEFHIKELGYWVDGYDVKKNTVIEVDEPHHFDSNGNLLDRDIRRQKEIIGELNCDFIRLKVDKYNKII